MDIGGGESVGCDIVSCDGKVVVGNCNAFNVEVVWNVLETFVLTSDNDIVFINEKVNICLCIRYTMIFIFSQTSLFFIFIFIYPQGITRVIKIK